MSERVRKMRRVGKVHLGLLVVLMCLLLRIGIGSDGRRLGFDED